MYESYYSFSGMPFQLTPDGRFYFDSQQHQKAMSFLEYGISQREGFVVVTGEIGAGKTTLVEHLLAMLDPQQYVVARIVTTLLGGYDLLGLIATAFKLYHEGMEKAALIARLTEYFSHLKFQGKHPLVIVDEAQSLTTEAIEEMRMLSNLNIDGIAPFQGIFLGQPEFRASLCSPGLEQFRQRVIASCHLGALSGPETRRYIEYRLGCVGWTDKPTFLPGAFEEIHRYSGGIPRRINTLCSRLLLSGYLEETYVIDPLSVRNVAEEMIAEVGALSGDRPRPNEQNLSLRESGANSNLELLARLDKLEHITQKHDRALVRVLDLALRYLPSQDSR